MWRRSRKGHHRYRRPQRVEDSLRHLCLHRLLPPKHLLCLLPLQQRRLLTMLCRPRRLTQACRLPRRGRELSRKVDCTRTQEDVRRHLIWCVLMPTVLCPRFLRRTLLGDHWISLALRTQMMVLRARSLLQKRRQHLAPREPAAETKTRVDRGMPAAVSPRLRPPRMFRCPNEHHRNQCQSQRPRYRIGSPILCGGNL